METAPVILIHGAGGNHLYWPPEIRRLPEFRIFAIDLPGHGKSEERGQQSIAAYAAKVLAWLKSLNLHRAVFAGHSMGAAIALYMALHHEEHVLGLALVGAGARMPVNGELLEFSSNATTFHKAVEIISQHAFSVSSDRRLVELATNRMADVRPSVLYGDLLACDAFDVTEYASHIRKPTLVLCGSEDRLIPPRFSQYLSGAIQGARLEIIPQAGHMVMLEAPLAVAGSLSRFLKSIPYIAG